MMDFGEDLAECVAVDVFYEDGTWVAVASGVD